MHRIHRQILELELPREQGAYAMQQRAALVFQEQVLPRLDEVFSRIAPAGRVVHIERLELDLGSIGEAGWERDFVEKCVAKIAEQVAEAAFASIPDSNIEIRVEADELADMLFYFLENGILPWQARHLTLSVLAEQIQENALPEKAFFQTRMLEVLAKEKVLKRLVWQFPPAFVQDVLGAAIQQSADWVAQLIQICQSQIGRSFTITEKAQIFAYLLEKRDNLRKNMPISAPWVAAFFAQTDTPLASQAGPKPMALQGKSDSKPVATQPKLPPPLPQKTSVAKPQPEGIPCENAGLVLLAPYLPAFLSNLGLAEKDGFVSDETRTQAIYMLHFFATGTDGAEEPALLLPKILCGHPTDAPLPPSEGLPPTMLEEAKELLEALIRNWPALKNTGPDGLRDAFLQRPGLLYWQETRRAWLLRVERLGQDMLLERLPWSYSVVKLGWMEEMVVVEW